MNIPLRSVRMAATLAVSVVSPATTAIAQTPAPAFPYGTIDAFPTVVQTGIKPTLHWSIVHPETRDNGGYLNYIRQVILPSEVTWDMAVHSAGQTMALLSTGPGAGVFELWTVDVGTGIPYLLDRTFVGSYIPMSKVVIRTEDPYSGIPRTRADRPFYVDVTVAGILSDSYAPDSAKSVTFFRHGQSYGEAGVGIGLDRSEATLQSQSPITTNGTQTFTYSMSSLPGPGQEKLRGEERFSVYSAADDLLPEEMIEKELVQIWPVADGTITGITEGRIITGSMPTVTFTLNDLYPDSLTHAQVYQGAPRSGATGSMIPGSSLAISDSVPHNRILSVAAYDSVIDSSGLWTMELLTETPFGTDRLACVTFLVLNDDSYQSLMYISGNGSYIPDGDDSPDAVDHTDWSGVAVNGGPVVRTFTIHNHGTGPLVLSGTPGVVVNGPHAADFTVTRPPGSPVAPGGSTTFDITFAPGSSGPRAAVLGIAVDSAAGDLYDFAIQGSGVTRESWRQLHFGSPENLGDGADSNDFDHDGLPNLIEFAFGLDPKQNSAGRLPAPEISDNHRVIHFTQPAEVGGVLYGAEWSTTLLPDDWKPVADTAVPPQHTFSVPADAKPRLYLRMKVTSP